MAERRAKYSKEFKEQAVKMVLEQGLNHSEVGRKLGVHSTNLPQLSGQIVKLIYR